MSTKNVPPNGLTVLGIDPGSQCLGWGVIREISGVVSLVACGTVRPKGDTFSERLGDLYIKLALIVREHAPQEAAIENVFTHKNAASALKLGQARGVAVAACAAHGVPVADYEPNMIKKSLVGAGWAEKNQVSFMVGRILGVTPSWAADTGDALACAVCHLNMRRMKRLAGL